MIQVVCAIIFKNRKVLVTQRGEHPRHAFQWEFPGGKIKPEETESQAILREIKEELDLDIEIAEQMKPVDFDYGFKKIRLVPFLCLPQNGEIVLNEHVDSKWVSWQELTSMNLSGADFKLLAQPENQNLLANFTCKD
jgi:8-oxo-dGTP diphosphatase